MIRSIVNFALVSCVVFLGNVDGQVRSDSKKSLYKPSYPTIVDAALAYNLTTLVQVVSATDLLSAVKDATTTVTLLAPTNEVSHEIVGM